MQSGSALSHWSHYAQFEARNLTMATIRPFKCGTPKSKKFLQCLQNVSAYELTKTEVHLTYSLDLSLIRQFNRIFPQVLSENVFKFLPVVEKANVIEAVITSPPAALTYYNPNITMMLGFTANEDDIFLSGKRYLFNSIHLPFTFFLTSMDFTDHVKSLSRFRIFMLNQLSNFFITGCLPTQFKYNSTIRNSLLYMFRSKYFANKYLHKDNIGSFSDVSRSFVRFIRLFVWLR